MKIAVIGTGAIGGYYGCMAANAGAEVHFLLRGDYEYVRQNGMIVRSAVHNDVILPNVNAYNDVFAMPKVDVVLVCLKTTANQTVLPDVLPHLADEHTVVLLIQNGLGMEQDVCTMHPGIQVAGATAQIAARKTEPGIIRHQDHGRINIGSYNVKETARLYALSDIFKKAGIPCFIENLNDLRWKKLVWNMTFNGLSVLYDVKTDILLSDQDKAAHCRQIMHEVITAADACKVNIPASFAEDTIIYTGKMRPYAPSMKLDYDFGRPLELEYMYQRPIEAAQNAGCEMLRTKALYQTLLKKEKERFTAV